LAGEFTLAGDDQAVTTPLTGEVTLLDGAVLAWGSNERGEVRHDLSSDTFEAPVSWSPDIPGLVAVSAGDLFSCGVDSDGTGWCWGRNHAGNLGDPSLPNGMGTGGFMLGEIAGYGFKDISAGSNNACGLTADG